jgi:CRISPR/Cas system-associated exonuclease Cas4 (RecB family)
MSKYYSGRRTRNLFDPDSPNSYKISRSKIDLFLNCPRCFYLDRRLGVGQPPGYPFSLNCAVDTLLKKEFDIHRKTHTAHPMMQACGIDALPFAHEKIQIWRDALKGGIEYLHDPTKFVITGAIDDIWADSSGLIFIVDYKSTSKSEAVSLDADWQISYKRQMEIYQWLFRKNGFKVSNTGYFVYCNGRADKETFDSRLEFDIKIIPYQGDDCWIEPMLFDLRSCLVSPSIPDFSQDCDYCQYLKAIKEAKA